MLLLSVVIRLACFVSSLGLIVVTLLTVTKAETGGAGSMGIGSIGGRAANTPVGTERILKPLTLWFGVTFVFTASLQAMPPDRFNTVALVSVPAFVAIMWFRQTIALKIRETFPNIFGEE